MSITIDQFRDVMRQLPAGVTIVTIRAGDEIHGLTVSAFVSVSAEPPLVAILINQQNHAHALLEREGAVFAVNILHEDQADLSDRFAWTKEDRFGVGEWHTAETGAPVLADALAWADCLIYERYAVGTHTIFIGHIQASHVSASAQKPLVYWNRAYRRLQEA